MDYVSTNDIQNRDAANRAIVSMVRILTVAVIMAFLAPGSAIAQEEGTAAPVEVPAEVSAEPVVVETQPPVLPTEPPAVPTEVPVVPTEVPVIPTEVPMQLTAIPTEIPTIAPTPTPIPLPVVSYAVVPRPECVLAPGQPAMISQGDSVDYICTHRVSVAGANVAPAAIGIDWDINATVDGGWAVSILPPGADPANPRAPWTVAGGTTRLEHLHTAASGSEPTTIDMSIAVETRIRIQRVVCGTVPQTVQVRHAAMINVDIPGATVTPAPVEIVSAQLAPDLAPIPEPSVAFEGPLDLGDVAVTAAGPDQGIRYGTVSLTVIGLDDACGRWALNVGATPLADASGRALNGASLVVVAINNEPLPDGACDLAGGCNVLTLPAGPDAAPSQTVVLGVELRMSGQPGPGSYGTSLSASLRPVSVDE